MESRIVTGYRQLEQLLQSTIVQSRNFQSRYHSAEHGYRIIDALSLSSVSLFCLLFPLIVSCTQPALYPKIIPTAQHGFRRSYRLPLGRHSRAP